MLVSNGVGLFALLLQGVWSFMIRLVVLAAALLIAAGCAGSRDQAAAQVHHHYFLIGKRACKHLVRRTQSTVTIYAVDFSSFPAKYRHDVAKGCAADR